MSRPLGRFTRSKARHGDSLRHQIPAPCLHSPPPQGIYIDRCITMQHWVSTVRNQKSGVRTSEIRSRKTLLGFRTLLLTLQWHTGVCEETFDVNSSSNNTKYLKFNCQKVESTRNGKLRRSSGRFQTLIWRPGETVQNLPDYLGELKALCYCYEGVQGSENGE